MTRSGWIIAHGLILAVVGAGCTTNITLEVDANPGQVGQTTEFTATVENPLACPFESAFLILQLQAPTDIIEEGMGVSSSNLCEVIAEPSLICAEIGPIGDLTPTTDEISEEFYEFCCMNPTFAEDNPDFCQACDHENAAAATVDLRQLLIDRATEAGWPVDKILSAQAISSDGTTSSECDIVEDGVEGVFAVCDLGTIDPMSSKIVTVSAESPLPGSFFNLAYLQGSAACADDNLLTGGITCVESIIVPPAEAPVLSKAVGIALVVLLASFGVVATRTRKRDDAVE